MDEKNYLVSIILPVYNVEQYLDRCLKSIIKQTYKNIEIIIIIDGSTDSSYKIALRWSEMDSRIQVIYQENAGSGPARNNGLDHAHGKFIMFVDPDDWIDEYMVESLIAYQIRENADLVLSKSRTVDLKENIISEEESTGELVFHTQAEARKNYLKLLGMSCLGAPTRKLYRTELIKTYKIEFPDLRRSQDIVFNYRYFDKISCVIAVDDIYYNYLIDDINYTNKLKSDYYKTLAYVFEEICKYCKSWNVPVNGEDFISACNYLFHSIVANLEANYLRREDIVQIYKNKNIKKIIEICEPNRRDEILIKKYCLSHKKVRIYIVLQLRLIYKRLKHSIENLYKKQNKYILSKTTLRKLQLTQLEILKETTRICKKLNIKYFLTDGTLLGAVRHQGFIPWDDDLDIAIFRKDYDRFIKLAQNELSDKFFLQTWETDSHYPFPYAKILKNYTICKEIITQGTNIHEGIFIDIFPIDSCGNRDEMSSQIKYYIVWTKILLMKCKYKVWKATNTQNSKVKYLPFIILSKLFSRKFIIRKIKNITNKWNEKYSNSGKCFENVGYNFLPWIVSKESFTTTYMLKFEDEYFNVPGKYDQCLKDIYGNYMQLPSEEERGNRHNIIRLRF